MPYVAFMLTLCWLSWQIILYVKEEMKKNNISEQTVVAIIWSSVMSTVEWNKKEELVAEQAIKHLKVLQLQCGLLHPLGRAWFSLCLQLPFKY